MLDYFFTLLVVIACKVSHDVSPVYINSPIARFFLESLSMTLLNWAARYEDNTLCS